VNYRLNYSDEARRALRILPGRYRQRARRLIESLAGEPRPQAAKELRHLPNRYRLWLNGWRIIYRVDDDAQRVLILAVRHKTGPEIYEDIE
jgi:mRNA-degrading endonuclease RelE of RelBE toxin-antitoxin system